ncbi:hypothetical protein [Terriglobus roseus]|uniref:Uncharacterized protein n=1 Tax=Terriglobus roseus TaxID=392734 RepID=A0A1G7R511_9BACT|nr:hypothetical protein [Terriglobus roseus]SDG05872.1 hypothetical protein SAMN05444167_4135 [Terriglobus roseus]
MVSLVRLLVSLVVAFAAFVVAFLAVFVPMLLIDMHYAPHDGQGGMGGFFLGVPVGAGVALVSGVAFYIRAERRNWFANSK